LFVVYFTACLQRCCKISQYSEIFTVIKCIFTCFLCIVLCFLSICKIIQDLEIFTNTLADAELVLVVCCGILLLVYNDVVNSPISIFLLVFCVLCCVSCRSVKLSKIWKFLQTSLADADAELVLVVCCASCCSLFVI
jgi:hypothetical protein